MGDAIKGLSSAVPCWSGGAIRHRLAKNKQFLSLDTQTQSQVLSQYSQVLNMSACINQQIVILAQNRKGVHNRAYWKKPKTREHSRPSTREILDCSQAQADDHWCKNMVKESHQTYPSCYGDITCRFVLEALKESSKSLSMAIFFVHGTWVSSYTIPLILLYKTTQLHTHAHK